jgi:hypothetical protein
MSGHRFLFFSITLLGILLIAACTGNTASIQPTKTQSQSNLQTNLKAPSEFINVCEPLDKPGVAFPRQEYVEGPREVMGAELIGKLQLKDGCLQIDSFYGDGFIIPVWPAEYTLAYEDNTLTVFDGDGAPLIREGEEVYMGGGEGSKNGLLECVRQKLPATCDGKFWFVGDGVRPNLRFDSELFNLSLITSTERTAVLLNKLPILDEWKEEPASITGNLVLYTPMRCPRIQSESGLSDFMPIWPQGYSLEITDGLIEISDTTGNLIAREGDELTLSGGGIPHSWDSGEYRRLYYELPGDCHAPYWIVDE